MAGWLAFDESPYLFDVFQTDEGCRQSSFTVYLYVVITPTLLTYATCYPEGSRSLDRLSTLADFITELYPTNMAATAACSPYADDAFGPIVYGCRGNFDFTLTFEQCFFAIAPTAAMLLFGSIRLYSLRCRQEKLIKNNFFKWTKVAVIAVLTALQLAFVVLWATTTALPARSYGIAAAVLSFLTGLLMAQLSSLEHTRSLRPSSILGAYLFFTMLFDAVILRTIWLSPLFSADVRAVITSAFCFKGAILVLEAKEKRQHLAATQDKFRSPEEFSGPYAQSLFWWLNELIRSGFKKILKLNDLYPIKQDLRAEVLSQRFRSAWQVCMSNTVFPRYIFLQQVLC